MGRLFVAFLSLILFSSMVSAIVIEEYDSEIDTPPIGENTSQQGDNINTAIIKDYMDQKIAELSKDAEQKVDQKIGEFNAGLIELMERAYSKIGVGVVTICLFLLQMFLFYKMFIDKPQMDYAPTKKEKKKKEPPKIDNTIKELEEKHRIELQAEREKTTKLQEQVNNVEKLSAILLEKQNNMTNGLKTMFGGDENKHL